MANIEDLRRQIEAMTGYSGPWGGGGFVDYAPTLERDVLGNVIDLYRTQGGFEPRNLSAIYQNMPIPSTVTPPAQSPVQGLLGFPGEVPTPYWETQNLAPQTPAMQSPHEFFNPNLGVYQGDLRLASRQLGFEDPFGEGRQAAWAQEQFGGWDPVIGKAQELQAEREKYAEDVYGIDMSTWAPGGVIPSQMDPRFDVPFGISRAAMRELGFNQPFGGGRGQAFVENVTPEGIINALGMLMSPGEAPPVTESTFAPPVAAPPLETAAFSPNYAMFYNPALMTSLSMAGRSPEFGSPYYRTMDYPAGASRFLEPPEAGEGAGAQTTEEIMQQMLQDQQFLDDMKLGLGFPPWIGGYD